MSLLSKYGIRAGVEPPTPPIVTSGLLLYYNMADPNSYSGSGTTIFDLSGNNRNGSMSNVSYSTTNGGIFSFNGSSSFVNTNYDLSWRTNSVTLSFALRPSSLSVQRPILGKGGSGAIWEWQFVQRNQNLTFVYWNTGGGHTNGPISSQSDEVLSTGIPNFFTSTSQFVILTLVWDGPANKYYLYRNGVLFYTINWVNASINQDRSNPVYLGGPLWLWGLESTYWNGSLGNMLIYNRALSAAEVEQNFNATKARFGL